MITHLESRNLRRSAFSMLASVATMAATPAPDDERMILVHEAYVVTFDASTVIISNGDMRALPIV